MGDFEERWRGTLEEAMECYLTPTNAITHLLYNDDGTYSIMSHIVCEHCDYCDEQGAWCGEGVIPVRAKPNPYINNEIFFALLDIVRQYDEGLDISAAIEDARKLI